MAGERIMEKSEVERRRKRMGIRMGDERGGEHANVVSLWGVFPCLYLHRHYGKRKKKSGPYQSQSLTNLELFASFRLRVKTKIHQEIPPIPRYLPFAQMHTKRYDQVSKEEGAFGKTT